jgi:MoaA/NifB/PqqE/SkfB family radical SAM enzyme
MIEKFGITQNLSGPQRIDLLFDRSCNLACRICGSHSSTFWEKHLRDNNLPTRMYYNKTDNLETVFNTLKSLDLSNLEMVQFCGGETLLGNTYWKAAEIIAELVPNAKNKITLGFQTNCTQPIDEKYYKIIEKFQLVKFMLSIDSTYNRFEYFRWPANWNQVVNNIMNFREKLPVNVMFFVQEVTSCLNLFYYNEVPLWLEQNFGTNRLGDPVGYARQLVMHKNLDVNNITQEYVDALEGTNMFNVLRKNWKENPIAIKNLIAELDQFDKIRNQNWKNTFPEVAGFYSRYL